MNWITLGFAAAACLPAFAQSFADAPAFGGSSVFSEGYDPMGNSARFHKPDPGWWLGYSKGDTGAKGARDAANRWLEAAGTTLPSADIALRLSAAPWAIHKEGLGTSLYADGLYHLGRETRQGYFAGPAAIDRRRYDIDRFVYGASVDREGTAIGFAFRLERITPFQRVSRPMDPALPSNYEALLDPSKGSGATLTTSIDGGFVTELAQGLRMGLTADRLVAKRLWDVEEKTQLRAGFQVDLGPSAQLSLEGDLNPAARLPFPVKQRSVSASLSFTAGPSATLLLGGERRTLAGVSTTTAGATLRLNLGVARLAAGFQFSKDRPLFGAALKVR